MKKLFYMISAVALMASFASCNKIEQENTSTDNTPVETPVVGETTTLTVSAAIPDTKTYWNSGKVKWLKGDMIKVLAEDGTAVMSNSMVYDEVVTGASPTYDFTVAEWPSDKTPLYAVFNGQDYDDVVLDKENITLVLKGEQMAHHNNSFDKTANTSVGVLEAGESGAYTTQMKNVCGLLKFSIEKLGDVTEVVIKDKNEKSMAGTLKVKMVNGVPEVQEIVNGSSEVSLTVAPNIGGDNMYFPLSSFYVCVLPDTYLPEITITSASAGPIVLTAKSEITVNRNEWIDLGAIDNVTESLSLTLDCAEGNILALPTAATMSGPDAYKVTIDEVEYEFTLYNPTNGYRYSNPCIRLGDGGYMKLPAITGYSLSKVEITGGNEGRNKYYYIYDSDPLKTEPVANLLGNVTVYGYETETISLSSSVSDFAYYLYATSSNAQFKKLVLTYTKVN